MQLIEIQRPLPESQLEEYKYKLLSKGWSYKVVTRVAEHFASEIESETDISPSYIKPKNSNAGKSLLYHQKIHQH